MRSNVVTATSPARPSGRPTRWVAVVIKLGERVRIRLGNLGATDHHPFTSYDDPGWYQDPPGTLAMAATPEQLQRDGITP